MGEVHVDALRSIDLDLYEGEFLVLLGASGSGKSSLLNILGGLDKPTRGSVHYLDWALTESSDDELTRFRREHVGFVFQFYNLIPSLSALENVELVTEISTSPMAAAEALRRVGLETRLFHFPAQLSGGEQQRVAIARALVNKPSILFGDEPTGNLDTRSGESILALFDQLHANGNTIVMVTHERDVAEHAERIISFRDGNVVNDEWQSQKKYSAAQPVLS